MSKRAYDIFAHVIKFLGANWQPKHITIEFFEAFDTFGHALAKDLIELLNKYDLRIVFLLMLNKKDLIYILQL
jgi:hypothetical protein